MNGMHPCRVLVLAVAFAGATVASARADGFISPFVGFSFGGDSANCPSLTSCEDKRLAWGASIGSTNGIFGLEADIAYAPDFFGKTAGGDNAMLTFMSNLMIVVPAGPIRPYGVVGLGLMRPHVALDALSLALDKNALGYDIGGGVNIFLTHGIGLRGDVRRLRTFNDVTLGVFGNDQINFWRGSAGVTFRF
jgi:outer membrane protein with beta-barrel domain